MENIYSLNTSAYTITDGDLNTIKILKSMSKTVGYYSSIGMALSTVNKLKSKFGSNWTIVDDSIDGEQAKIHDINETVRYKDKKTGIILVRKYWTKHYPIDKELP